MHLACYQYVRSRHTHYCSSKGPHCGRYPEREGRLSNMAWFGEWVPALTGYPPWRRRSIQRGYAWAKAAWAGPHAVAEQAVQVAMAGARINSLPGVQVVRLSELSTHMLAWTLAQLDLLFGGCIAQRPSSYAASAYPYAAPAQVLEDPLASQEAPVYSPTSPDSLGEPILIPDGAAEAGDDDIEDESTHGASPQSPTESPTSSGSGRLWAWRITSERRTGSRCNSG